MHRGPLGGKESMNKRSEPEKNSRVQITKKKNWVLKRTHIRGEKQRKNCRISDRTNPLSGYADVGGKKRESNMGLKFLQINVTKKRKKKSAFKLI